MRILYSHRIQSRDGMSVHVEELVTALLQAGHDVRVVGPRFYADSGFGGESRTVARLRRLLPGALGELAELAYNVPALLRLRREHASFRPDLIYERYNLYFLAGILLARITGTRLFLEVNSPLAAERARFGTLRLGTLARALERFTWRAADRVLAVTEVLRQAILAEGVQPDRAVVVANGVVAERYMSDDDRRGADDVVLGFVGFVRDWHGLDAVIDGMAAARVPGLRLTVVGDGPARPALEAQATRLGLGQHVAFTGVVDHALIPGVVAGFDVALQPKVVAYASPLKIFDYMAAGRAIVAPDQPNIREVLEHERTGLLFDPDAPGAMWASVARLVGDPVLRARLGLAARQELERRDFTWAGNARRIVAMAETLDAAAIGPDRS